MSAICIHEYRWLAANHKSEVWPNNNEYSRWNLFCWVCWPGTSRQQQWCQIPIASRVLCTNWNRKTNIYGIQMGKPNRNPNTGKLDVNHQNWPTNLSFMNVQAICTILCVLPLSPSKQKLSCVSELWTKLWSRLQAIVGQLTFRTTAKRTGIQLLNNRNSTLDFVLLQLVFTF